jgi:CRISPR-associated protein Csx17
MTTHRLVGLRPTTLLNYLASLGLFRLVAEQADPAATSRWEGQTFIMEASVDDLAAFLVDRYHPTPVVSPWNGGSGYGEKDVTPQAVLDALTTTGADRLAGLAAAHQVAGGLASRAVVERWTKARFISELRNWLPDAALSWLDAAVVLTDDGAQYPPLLGTGGNDGRLDFSTNFHQRLTELLPELGAPAQRSKAWASDLLYAGASTALSKAAAGQFDPLAAGGPGSSSLGSADSLVNPWGFVLMVEGALLFAASATKRMGESGSRASIPFTVQGSPYGPIPGAEQEESRGEVWAPLWGQAATMAELRHVFSQAKASWDGATSRRSAQMYAAARSGGIDQRITRLVRFGFLQRNGLAFTAVRLDVVDVHTAPGIDLLIPIEHRARAFHLPSANATGRLLWAQRAFEEARVRFARGVEADALIDLLAALTDLEWAVGTSQAGREHVSRAPARPDADSVVTFLTSTLERDSALRLGASLASARCLTPDGEVSLGRLVLGEAPSGSRSAWRSAVVTGAGVRPFVETLAEAVQWLAVHPVGLAPVGRGFMAAVDHRLRVSWPDVHSWLQTPEQDAPVERAFRAFAALSWDRPIHFKVVPAQRPDILLAPTLAVLDAFARGLVVGVGGLLDADRDRVGLDPSWPTRLTAGRSAVEQVDAEACERLARQRYAGATASAMRARGDRTSNPALRVRVTPMVTPPDGTRLLAMLLVGVAGSPLMKLVPPDHTVNP